MPLPQATKIELTQRQREELLKIKSKQKEEYRLVIRAKIILFASDRYSNSAIARHLHIKRDTVIMWRNRWVEETEKLNALELCEDLNDFTRGIVEILGDKPRPGAPSTFTAEQVCQIISIACTPPTESESPVSHWSGRQLKDEVLKREIVPSISTRTVGRFLKSGRIKASPN